tara:strand:- start:5321 stop:5545 length:225 start_codon:yes stop_codon:yes gene_type:complete
MLQGLVAKKIISVVIKRIMEKSELRKMRKYVEEDNELDLIAKDHEKRLRKLEKKSHKPRDFVTCDCCKKKLKTK